MKESGGWRRQVKSGLAGHTSHTVLMICIPESAAHGLVVHVWLVLVQPPQPGHRLAVHQLEDALLSVGPLDVLGTALFVLGRKIFLVSA